MTKTTVATMTSHAPCPKNRHKAVWSKKTRRRYKRLRKIARAMSTEDRWFIAGLTEGRRKPYIQGVSRERDGTIIKGEKFYV